MGCENSIYHSTEERNFFRRDSFDEPLLLILTQSIDVIHLGNVALCICQKLIAALAERKVLWQRRPSFEKLGPELIVKI